MSVQKMGRSLSLFALLCLTSRAHAIVIDVDPGPVGSMPAVVVLPFIEFNGMTFDGSPQSLDFVFSGMKRLELTLEGLVQYRAELEFAHDGDFLNGPEFPPFHTASLSDELGDPIISAINNVGLGQDTGKFYLISQFFSPDADFVSADPPSEHVVDGLIHHGVHVDFTLPSSGDLITGAELRLLFLPLTEGPGPGGNPLGSGSILVGPVPEPATAMLAMLLAGLSLVFRSARFALHPQLAAIQRIAGPAQGVVTAPPAERKNSATGGHG